ncbi:MAG: chemotaxis protein CheW [Gemmatimonadaceae bacterium]|nr:chemotaxis protein CheW [Gemmatimonadaceae bacterium]MBA3645892.1 chemotaxis protein CheW [Gemmatimonadaceae bacterium]
MTIRMLPPQSTISLLLAQIDGSAIGFPSSAVHGIHRAVAIAPLPAAPDVIEGAINLHGRIVPVVDLRRLFVLSGAVVSPDQFLIILGIADRLIAVRVDDVLDVTEVSRESFESPSKISPALKRLAGVAATEAGVIVVYDVDAFLTQAEMDALDVALSPQA